jgi:hypothetical protein
MSLTGTRPCLRLRSRWGRRCSKSAINETDARCSLTSSSSPVLISCYVLSRYCCFARNTWAQKADGGAALEACASHAVPFRRVHLTPRRAFLASSLSHLDRCSCSQQLRITTRRTMAEEAYRDYLAARVLTENQPVRCANPTIEH